MILLDTDHFSVWMDARHALHSQLVERLETASDLIEIPVVSIEEQLRAWLAQIHRIRDVHGQLYPYERLVRLLEVLAEWRIARWTVTAADEFSRLRKQRIRIGTQDLKIASLAISCEATLLSANLRDFQMVPGLKVEDWLYG